MRDFLLVRVMWQATSSSRLNWSCTKQWPWLKTTSSCNSFKCLPSIFSPVDQDQVVRAVQVAGAGGRGVLLLAQTLGAACDTLLNLFSCHRHLTCSPYLAPFQSPGKRRRGTLVVRRRFFILIQLWPTLPAGQYWGKNVRGHMRGQWPTSTGSLGLLWIVATFKLDKLFHSHATNTTCGCIVLIFTL